MLFINNLDSSHFLYVKMSSFNIFIIFLLFFAYYKLLLLLLFLIKP